MLQRLLAIVRKELITMLRDPRARLALIIPPIIQLFIFSSAATMEVKNIALAVVDLDRGPYAADVQQRLAGSRSFTRPSFCRKRWRSPRAAIFRWIA